MDGTVLEPLKAAVFSDETMQKVSLFESPQMFCDVYCLNPGQEQKPHTHDGNDKLYYALSGTCHVILGDTETLLEAGQLAVAPSGVVHGVVNRGAAPATLLVVMAPHPKYQKV